MGWRNAHQAFDVQLKALPAIANEFVRSLGQDASFLRFLADIDLDIDSRRLSRPRHFLCQFGRKFRTINALDGVKQPNSIPYFVCLKGADQAEAKFRVCASEGWPLFCSFLNAIFAEILTPRRYDRRYSFRGHCLRDADEPNIFGASAAFSRRPGDAALDSRQAVEISFYFRHDNSSNWAATIAVHPPNRPKGLVGTC